MLSYLADFDSYFGPLRLFRYLTFRSAMAGMTAMGIGFLMGPWLIARLRLLRARQSIQKRPRWGA